MEFSHPFMIPWNDAARENANSCIDDLPTLKDSCFILLNVRGFIALR